MYLPFQARLTWTYRGGLLEGKMGRGGRGGRSGRVSLSEGTSVLTLLPVDVFLRWVRSDRLEEQECSVL